MPDLDKLTAALMAEFSQSGIAELALQQGDFEIYLSTSGRARRQSSAPASSAIPSSSASLAVVTALPSAPLAQTADLPAGARIVNAPNLGTFYRAPKPGAAPYVEIGDTVAEGEELCLIEVMKLFTAVRAEAAGRLHAVLAEDGSMVEAGQPLFALVSD
jgi:acetyl-CoA carboxylase biotin carboxyl carrier protein